MITNDNRITALPTSLSTSRGRAILFSHLEDVKRTRKVKSLAMKKLNWVRTRCLEVSLVRVLNWAAIMLLMEFFG